MTETVTKVKQIVKYIFLGVIGGGIYYNLELIWREYSHWTMFLLGGICFIALGLINELLSWDTPLISQMVIGSLIITTLELITGCIVNLWLGWNVWDYSNQQFNVLGQICPLFSFLWLFVGTVAIILDDYLRYWLFGEEKPRYKLF